MANSTVLLIGPGNIGGEVVRQLREKGCKVLTAGIDAGVDFPCDMKDLNSVLALGPAIPDGVDHVVICAGHSSFGNISKFNAQSWYENFENKLLSVSRTAMLLLNGEELKLVKDGGSITLTSGLAARTTNRNWPAIAANCAALDAFVRCAGIDAPRGVRLNAVAPTTVKETAEAAGQDSTGTVPRAVVAAMYVESLMGTESGKTFLGGDPGAPKSFGEEVFNYLHKKPKADGAPLKVRIASGAGETLGVDDISVAASDSLGFWKEEGLEVEWIPARGGVKACEAVLAGKADVAYGTFAPIIAARARGEPTRVLASMARGLAQGLVVRKDRVPNIEALKGVRWAVDGIGALSHNMAALIVESTATQDVEWVVAGPPPERIAQVLDGRCDCSLLRVEEAAALTREHPDKLATLLSVNDLNKLVSKQPHGVLSCTETFERTNPELCEKLVRGLMKASRALHDSQDNFHRAVRNHVKHVTPSDEEIRDIWQTEHNHGAFAVNGGMSSAHWDANFDMYYRLNPAAAAGKRPTFEELMATTFAKKALATIGTHSATFDKPA